MTGVQTCALPILLPVVDDNNMVAVIAHDGELFVINVSKIDLEYCYSTGTDNPIKKIIKTIL